MLFTATVPIFLDKSILYQAIVVEKNEVGDNYIYLLCRDTHNQCKDNACCWYRFSANQYRNLDSRYNIPYFDIDVCLVYQTSFISMIGSGISSNTASIMYNLSLN